MIHSQPSQSSSVDSAPCDSQDSAKPKQNLKLLQKHKLEVGRFSVPYAITGGNGTALFAINGAQQTMASWISLLKYFTKHSELRLVLMDFPGQGRAEINEGSPEVNLEEQLEVLRAVTEEVSPDEPFFLIGGSWGGVVAAGFSARYPDRVSKLILGSFSTSPNEAIQKVLSKGQELFEQNHLEEVANLLIDGFGGHLSGGKKDMLRQQFSVMSLDHLKNLYAQTFAMQNCKDISEYVDLGAIGAETLIVNGGRDPIIDSSNTKEAAARIPKASYRILDEVGHFLHVEAPEVLDLYGSFLLDE